jgi:hypothetical protein
VLSALSAHDTDTLHPKVVQLTDVLNDCLKASNAANKLGGSKASTEQYHLKKFIRQKKK